ncbi:MAG: polysaccharide deacetylase family protein [Bacillota bacterium]
MKYSYDPPILVKKIFSGFNWNTLNNKVLLTFDDGPIPETTEIILKLLDEYHIKAAFFCVGNNILKNPGLANEIIKSGHEIGNHTFNHKRLTAINISIVEKEIRDCSEIISKSTGKAVKHFRPPHGRFDLRIAKFLKKERLSNVMWSLLTFDYKNQINIVKFALKKYLKTDSIIVFHDSLKSKDIIIDSLKACIDEVYKKEFEFGVPEECLK